jgi:hypothetical protein
VARACDNRQKSPTNENSQMMGHPENKIGVTRKLELLNAKIVELKRTLALKAVEQSEAAQQMCELQQDNANWEHKAIYEKSCWEAAAICLT